MNIVKQLKENNQDFEWYPTTFEMLEVIKIHSQKKLKRYPDDNFSGPLNVLDIGCGDGRGAKILSCGGKKLFIEKSEILRNSLSHEFIPMGTDFHIINLISFNKVDVVFCNPPYSEYVNWTKKILSQSNTSYLYLIIPTRWKDDEEIEQVIKIRNIEYNIIGTFDFLDAERKARAVVDIVCFDIAPPKKYKKRVDSFDIWFNEAFPTHKDNNKKEYISFDEKEKKKKEEIEKNISQELVTGKNYLEALVTIYDKELLEFLNVFKTLNNTSPTVLKALDITQEQMSSTLKTHISTLKNKYWLEFFNRYKPIKDKLTTYGRKILIDELNKDMVTLDFNNSNAYAVTVWAIKQVNNLYDDQIVDLMNKLTTYANIKLYKSNQRTFDDEDWRYNKNDIRQTLNKYYLSLDLRIVLKNAGNIRRVSREYVINDWDYKNNLHKTSHDLIDDILTVANNLGLKIESDSSYDRIWYPSEEQTFYFKDGSILLKTRAYLNGNFHLKLNIEFLKAFNIEFGRIKKWLKNKKDVQQEMNLSKEDIDKFFNNNYKLLPDKEILQICN